MALTIGHTTSAGETVQAAFPQAQVVKAFNTVLAQVLAKAVSGAKSLPSILVAGNHAVANAVVVELAKDTGFGAVDTGALTNARYLESLAVPTGRRLGTRISQISNCSQQKFKIQNEIYSIFYLALNPSKFDAFKALTTEIVAATSREDLAE